MTEGYSNFVVLVAEDKKAMRSIITSVLHHIGVRHVLTAQDGLEAFEQLQARNLSYPRDAGSDFANDRRHVDLLLCDWMMPKMTGLELLQAVRARAELKDLPFIMLTAENERDSVANAILNGVTDYIIKPFSHAMLEQKLRAAFTRISAP